MAGKKSWKKKKSGGKFKQTLFKKDKKKVGSSGGKLYEKQNW